MSKGIKLLSESRALLQGLPQAAGPQAAAELEAALKSVASVDGDRVLDQFEAEAYAQAFAGLPAGPIDVASARRVRQRLDLQIETLKAERAQSTEVLFTSEGRALDRFRGKILGAMDASIAKAEGKPVDINMMVFAFTDADLADGILERARANPNVNFRLLTDWTQLSESGSKQARRIGRTARQEGLENIQIKYKRDNPYVWNEEKGRPVFHHPASKGLNHHKGFVTLIDGRPEKMVFGSFNWSRNAMKKNYENMMLLDRSDADHRPVMAGYDKEFAAFWNNDDVALTEAEALREKGRLYSELYAANGHDVAPRPVHTPDEADPIYERREGPYVLDINSFADADAAALSGLIGKGASKSVAKELRDYGRFDSRTELLARVPKLATLPAWKRERLLANMEFGDGGLSVNTASASELDRAGLSAAQAKRLVALRERHGSFESVEAIREVRGIGGKTLARVEESLSDDHVTGYYSGRAPEGRPQAGFADHGTVKVPSRGPFMPGQLSEIDADLAAPVRDMLRRTPEGQTVRIAMYGMSTRSPEYQEMVQALERGVPVRLVLYGKYAASAVAALDALKQRGLDVDYRTLKSRVMHEKFGVTGDDLFNGSANWSTSAMNKHAEDRFAFRNEPELANRFVEEFARLWERGTAPQ